MTELKTVGLFALTALAEIAGCYLPYLWLREGKSIWLLIPGALSLVAFVWLLSLHPTAVGRVYAAYGGVYVVMAILWLWTVNGIRPTTWDYSGFDGRAVRDGDYYVCTAQYLGRIFNSLDCI